MGLLDKLWDDVLAGPQPDQGLKKLRKERLGAHGLSDVFQDGMCRFCRLHSLLSCMWGFSFFVEYGLVGAIEVWYYMLR